MQNLYMGRYNIMGACMHLIQSVNISQCRPYPRYTGYTKSSYCCEIHL